MGGGGGGGMSVRLLKILENIIDLEISVTYSKES